MKKFLIIPSNCKSNFTTFGKNCAGNVEGSTFQFLLKIKYQPSKK